MSARREEKARHGEKETMVQTPSASSLSDKARQLRHVQMVVIVFTLTFASVACYSEKCTGLHTHPYPQTHPPVRLSMQKNKPYARSQMSKQVTSIVRENQDQINRQDSFEMQERRLVLALFFITTLSTLASSEQNTFPKMDTLKVFTRMHI